jgi:hypothetical protein
VGHRHAGLRPSHHRETGTIVGVWSDAGVTEYKIYYSKTPFDSTTLLPDTFVIVDNATSYTLTGLTNGQSYFVAVSAIAQAGLFVAVTAYDVRGEVSTTQLVPGLADESAFSQEEKVGSGAASESAISNVKQEFPDELIKNPDLENRRVGCFIATAAYGHYSAPQVRALLRSFPEVTVVTSELGRPDDGTDAAGSTARSFERTVSCARRGAPGRSTTVGRHRLAHLTSDRPRSASNRPR